ncbi:cysteine desulfurase [Ruminococcaceae bacterium OttesenSCG-928-L11]|nr:cysteine desulfurase [Ruminococcaceae bacterium OttesenSCG-928-L11]
MQEIYLDNAATTKVDHAIALVALEMMEEAYGNPSSRHGKGLEAELRLNKAREQVAAVMGAAPEEVYFTSGGTEANNIAIQGGVDALRRRGNHIVTTAVEHSSVKTTVEQLERQGFAVTRILPDSHGTIDPAEVVGAVTDKTILVSCMLVNSETGALHPVESMFTRIRRKNKLCMLHCDGVQAFGKLPLSVKKLGADLLSVSAHKIHGPKGCGALYVHKGARVNPLYFGGSQERGIRPGTESTALIAAFGAAAEQAGRDMTQNQQHVREVCEYFVNKANSLAGICMNSPPDSTPYIQNLSVPGYRSETLLHYLEQQGVYVSSGSACSKGAKSHVLAAMGLSAERIDSALRVSFSRYSTTEEVDKFFAALEAGMATLIRAK